MTKQIWMLLMILAFVLTACSGAPAPTMESPVQTEAPAALDPVQATESPMITEAAAATEAVVMTEAPVVTEAAAQTDAPGTPAAVALGSAVVYRIVPGESQVSYEVGETFLEQNRFSTAIGVTPEVNGEITLDTANPQSASIGPITVDVSQFASDSSRRDNTLRDRFLESAVFPQATFVTTSIEGLPAAYTEGQEVTFKVTGDLTVREVSQPVTFDVTAKVENGALTGSALTTIKMSDFGVGPISMAMLSTEDDVKLTLTFVARP